MSSRRMFSSSIVWAVGAIASVSSSVSRAYWSRMWLSSPSRRVELGLGQPETGQVGDVGDVGAGQAGHRPIIPAFRRRGAARRPRRRGRGHPAPGPWPASSRHSRRPPGSSVFFETEPDTLPPAARIASSAPCRSKPASEPVTTRVRPAERPSARDRRSRRPGRPVVRPRRRPRQGRPGRPAWPGR